MDKLKLPVIKKNNLKSKCLSFDDYVQFINFNLKYTLDRKAYRQMKRDTAVNALFKI